MTTQPVPAQEILDSSDVPEGCIPPLEPYAFEPPRDDTELLQLVDEEYQIYLIEIEAYLNCLQEEQRRAIRRANSILQQYVRFFGSAAGIESTVQNRPGRLTRAR